MSMSLEQFAEVHGLPGRWLLLWRCCETLARHPQFWCRPDLQHAAQKIATEASDILREQRRDLGNQGSLCGKPTDMKIA
jgi:hypothetical protein